MSSTKVVSRLLHMAVCSKSMPCFSTACMTVCTNGASDTTGLRTCFNTGHVAHVWPMKHTPAHTERDSNIGLGLHVHSDTQPGHGVGYV